LGPQKVIPQPVLALTRRSVHAGSHTTATGRGDSFLCRWQK